MSKKKDWRDYPNLDEVAKAYKTVQMSGATNMLDLRYVEELCRDYDMLCLGEFLQLYGADEMFVFFNTLDWDAVPVDENMLYELGG